MKKIFAIALALVMVLSMASAFALNDCFSGFDWTCSTTTTNCGKGKIEVVPYVKVNNGCGSYDWQVSTCATAINSENVYFAVKLTIDAYPDKAWWDAATIEYEAKGLEGLPKSMTLDTKQAAGFTVDEKEDEALVYYLKKDVTGWVKEDDAAFDLKNVVISAKVKDAAKAKFCATLESEYHGFTHNSAGAGLAHASWKYGDYTVTLQWKAKDAGKMTITNDCGKKFVMSWVDGKVNSITGDAAFVAEVQAKFNLSGCVIGTCVDEDIVQRNFGWDDEFESCFNWSNKGASVVDPECVVSIPKTGDVSVVAYAVMAVVAAAGAMLKK